MRKLTITPKLTLRETNSFVQYLREINEIELFTPEQEMECVNKSSKGDQKAIHELVRRNLRFVISVAKQYNNQESSLEDLVNEGNIGLLEAAERFKPDMGFKFITYAVWWIRKVIMEHLSENGRMIRLPANKVFGLYQLSKQFGELEQKYGRSITIDDVITEYCESPTDDEIDKETRYKKIGDEFKLLNSLNQYSMDSLDRDISGPEENGSLLSDTISDESIFKPTDYNLITKDLKEGVNKALDILKPRDKQIIIGLFGLNGEIPRTLKDLGDEMGITREMVRQIREKSLLKLNNQLKNSELKL